MSGIPQKRRNLSSGGAISLTCPRITRPSGACPKTSCPRLKPCILRPRLCTKNARPHPTPNLTCRGKTRKETCSRRRRRNSSGSTSRTTTRCLTTGGGSFASRFTTRPRARRRDRDASPQDVADQVPRGTQQALGAAPICPRT